MDAAKRVRREQADAKECRGFNLIEAAVVLGIIGLVVGGVWTAASSIAENQLIATTAEGLTFSAQRARSLYPQWAIQQTVGNGTGDITQQMIAAGAIYPSWVISGAVAKIPAGDSRFSIALQGNTLGLGNGTVNLTLFPPLKKSICSRIVTLTSTQGSQELALIAVAGTPTTTFSTFPISPNSANSACAASPLNYIALYYKAL